MNKNIVITRSDSNGKCIAFEFELYGATFTCRKKNDKEWILVQLTPFKDSTCQMPMNRFAIPEEDTKSEKVYKWAMYNIMMYANDTLAIYIDVVDILKDKLGFDNAEVTS